MSTRIRQLLDLLRSPGDIILLLRIASWIIIEPLLVRILTVPRLMKWLTPHNPPGRVDQALEDKVIKYAFFFLRRMPNAEEEAERRVSAFAIHRSCLKRSLVLFRFLRLAGIPVVFHIGVRKENEKLKGHSWLTRNNASYFPDEDTRYNIVYQYPAAERKGNQEGGK